MLNEIYYYEDPNNQEKYGKCIISEYPEIKNDIVIFIFEELTINGEFFVKTFTKNISHMNGHSLIQEEMRNFKNDENLKKEYIEYLKFHGFIEHSAINDKNPFLYNSDLIFKLVLLEKNEEVYSTNKNFKHLSSLLVNISDDKIKIKNLLKKINQYEKKYENIVETYCLK